MSLKATAWRGTGRRLPIGTPPYRWRHVTAFWTIDNLEVHGPRQADLRHPLNEWDLIGVADLVDDEYDCLLAPLWDRLTRGATGASLSEYL